MVICWCCKLVLFGVYITHRAVPKRYELDIILVQSFKLHSRTAVMPPAGKSRDYKVGGAVYDPAAARSEGYNSETQSKENW
jgi:hypothetical protein